MSLSLITLDDWLARTYGGKVSIHTARRWCRERRIFPAPEKHGRTYFVRQDARYTAPAGDDDLTARVRRDYADAAQT